MNSSLARTCAARGRLLHRSKNLVLTSVPQSYPPAQFTYTDGKLSMKWLIVDRSKVNGKNNGITFNAGFKRTKSAFGRGLGRRSLRELRDRVWHGIAP